jgi:hypothetical protein
LGPAMKPSSDIESPVATFPMFILLPCPSGCDRLLGAYGNSLENHHRFEILRKFEWDGSGGLAERKIMAYHECADTPQPPNFREHPF